MKRIFFILIAVSLVSVSCSEASPGNDSYSNLVGQILKNRKGKSKNQLL
ncbi:MAG TPA: hypothetical protein VF842_11665 [Flavobacterium sp.]